MQYASKTEVSVEKSRAEIEGTCRRYGATSFASGWQDFRRVLRSGTAAVLEAHFATYPPKLVRPCIKAGTSERGCCPTCGAPWRRVVDVAYCNPGNRSTNGPRSTERKSVEFGTAGFAVRMERKARTVDWLPTCSCPAHDAVPCTVLDPFSGAATTGVVCLELGRRYVGIERKMEYLQISRARISNIAENKPVVGRQKPTTRRDEPGLFDQVGGDSTVKIGA